MRRGSMPSQGRSLDELPENYRFSSAHFDLGREKARSLWQPLKTFHRSGPEFKSGDPGQKRSVTLAMS